MSANGWARAVRSRSGHATQCGDGCLCLGREGPWDQPEPRFDLQDRTRRPAGGGWVGGWGAKHNVGRRSRARGLQFSGRRSLPRTPLRRCGQETESNGHRWAHLSRVAIGILPLLTRLAAWTSYWSPKSCPDIEPPASMYAFTQSSSCRRGTFRPEESGKVPNNQSVESAPAQHPNIVLLRRHVCAAGEGLCGCKILKSSHDSGEHATPRATQQTLRGCGAMWCVTPWQRRRGCLGRALRWHRSRR